MNHVSTQQDGTPLRVAIVLVGLDERQTKALEYGQLSRARINDTRGVPMKLLLKRDQKSGLMGGVTFLLDVRAELTEEEKRSVSRYKLGNTMLYERDKIVDPGRGLLGLASRVAFKMTNLSVSVNDLSSGKHIECKDIVEMLAVEEQIREASQTFQAVLTAAATFGGEEVVEIS